MDYISEKDLRLRVGSRVLLLRRLAGLSQEDVAGKAGETRNFVSAIERGAIGLDAYRLRRVAGALDTTIGWFLGEPGSYPPPAVAAIVQTLDQLKAPSGQEPDRHNPRR